MLSLDDRLTLLGGFDALKQQLVMEMKSNGKIICFFYRETMGRPVGFYESHPKADRDQDFACQNARRAQREAQHRKPYRGEIVPFPPAAGRSQKKKSF